MVAREDHRRLGRAVATASAPRCAIWPADCSRRPPSRSSRGRAQRLEVGLERCASQDVLGHEESVISAVVLGGHPEHLWIRGRLVGESRVHRSHVAHGDDEPGHGRTRTAAQVRVMDRPADRKALPRGRAGRTRIAARARRAIRTCSGCFAARASALTAPPLAGGELEPLARTDLGDDPMQVVGVLVGRGLASGSAFTLRSTPRGS